MNIQNLLATTAGVLAGLSAWQVHAATTYSGSVHVNASASGTLGITGPVNSFDGGFGATPIAYSAGTGVLTGVRDVVFGYDGRCVVIATGAPCQGGEAPLTTMTILDTNKPVTAQQGTFASASASAHARSGSIGAYASTSASVGTDHTTVNPNNPTLSVPGAAISTGNSLAQASAGFVLTNTLLGPAGSMTTISLRGVASSDLDVSNVPGFGNSARVTMQVRGHAAPAGQNCSNFALGCVAEFGFTRFADPNSLTPVMLGNDQRRYSFSFNAYANDLVTLQAFVAASSTNSGYADASHTLTIDEIELGSGFTFADESGLVRNGNRYTFAAAVPEPESYALILAGLGLIAWRVRARGL